jgi:REP element-mobilizing transposase RayT
MFQISRDNPAYYLTSVAHDRLPIFQTNKLKQIACDAFNEARISGGFMIFAYVIMLDHTHFVTDNARDMAAILRFLNGISAKRIIADLKGRGLESSLSKLRVQERRDRQKYSV